VKIAADNYSVIIQGNERIRLLRFEPSDTYLRGEFEVLRDEQGSDVEHDVELEALFRNLKNTTKQVAKSMPDMPKEISQMVDGVNDPSQLCDLVAANMEVSVEEKQEVLSTSNLKDRLKRVVTFLARQLEVLKVHDKIQSQIKEEIDKSQREYYLRQQLKAIKRAARGARRRRAVISTTSPRRSHESAQLARRGSKRPAANSSTRLRMMQPASSEYGVTRTYVETLLDIPWNKSRPRTTSSVSDARPESSMRIITIWTSVKKRIVEYLAVRKLKERHERADSVSGRPSLGSAKPVLGRSPSLESAWVESSSESAWAESTTKSEIRGHRRTYVGALAGTYRSGRSAKCRP
jgi:ATP-dependent Lon protease